MSDPLVVEVERSGFVESAHLVDVVVVDGSGRLVAHAGEPERPAAFRSSAKPLQAAISAEAGWSPGDDEAIAIACASHNGEPGHVEAVRALLAAAGAPEEALRCPEAWPFRPDDVSRGAPPQRIVNNCSGKHAAMVAACIAAGWPLDDYRAPSHPLQERTLARMRDVLGLDPALLVDGCGVPTFVAPLVAIARAFARVAGTREAAAMLAHPWLVGGTGRFDTDLMAAADGIVAKAGAEGLSCVVAGDLSLALKSRDGLTRGRSPAVVAVLEQLDLLDPAAIPQHAEPGVFGGGERVGSVRARGTLVSG